MREGSFSKSELVRNLSYKKGTNYMLLNVKLSRNKELNGSHQIQLIPYHRAALWGHRMTSHIKKCPQVQFWSLMGKKTPMTCSEKKRNYFSFFPFSFFPHWGTYIFWVLSDTYAEIFFFIVCIYKTKSWLVTRCFSFATFQDYFVLVIYHPVKMSSRES